MTLNDIERQPPAQAVTATGPTARWLLRALALAGLGVTCYLGIAGAGGGLAGCGPTSGCGEVMASRWSRVGSLPVAALAAGLYLVVFAALLHVGPRATPPRRRAAWVVLLVAAAAAAGAAVWFVFLQLALLRALCPWCMAAHAIAVVTALVIVALAPIAAGGISPKRAAAALLIGAMGAGGLAAAQFVLPTPTHQTRFGTGRDFDQGRGPERKLSFFGGLVHVAPHELPMLGSSDAPYVIAYVYDYTCIHCRATHRQLKEAMAAYGDQLGVLMLCAPYDAACNPALARTPAVHEGACELAKLSAAVWRADRTRFADFHDWLFASIDPRRPRAAREQAASLVGADALDAAMADPWIDEQVRRSLAFVQLHERATVPMLAARRAVIYGRPASARVVIDFVADTFGIAPPPLPADAPVPAR